VLISSWPYDIVNSGQNIYVRMLVPKKCGTRIIDSSGISILKRITNKATKFAANVGGASRENDIADVWRAHFEK